MLEYIALCVHLSVWVGDSTFLGSRFLPPLSLSRHLNVHLIVLDRAGLCSLDARISAV